MEDSIHHKQLRQKLLNSLHLKGINDVKVLEAMNKVPCHLFVNDDQNPAEAYADKPMNIGNEQTITQPYTVAYQTSLLDIKPHEKVLEVGTGSGYQAAILFELGADVFTIERQKKLFYKAKQRLIHLGYAQIKTIYGDGNEGIPGEQPFDKILLTAAADEIPKKLIDQLKINGVLVAPLGKEIQKMVRVTKKSPTQLEIEEFDHFQFVPLLNGLVE